MVPLVSTCQAYAPVNRGASFLLCIRGSPPETTTVSTWSRARRRCISLTVVGGHSRSTSYRSRSHVYGVSHHSHDRLHRPRRTNPTRRPVCGPSPCHVGPNTSDTGRSSSVTAPTTPTSWASRRHRPPP